MSCLQASQDLPERDRHASRDRSQHWFIGGPELVGVLDTDHTSPGQRSGVHDRAGPRSAYLLARAPGQVRTPMTRAVRIFRWLERPGDGEGLRQWRDPGCGRAGVGWKGVPDPRAKEQQR